MTMKTRSPLWTLPFLCLAGCGGGGGGGGGAVAPPAPVTPATQARQLQQGDFWELQGTWRQNSVTVRIDILQGTTQAPDGTPCLTQVRTATATVPLAGAQVVEDRLLVTPDGLTCGRIVGGVPDWVTDRQLTPMPTPFAVGGTETEQLTYQSGLVEDRTTTITAAERIVAAAGTFDCWRKTDTRSDNQGASTTSTVWAAPDVGMVKIEGQFASPDGGQTVQVTASLTSFGLQ